MTGEICDEEEPDLVISTETQKKWIVWTGSNATSATQMVVICGDVVFKSPAARGEAAVMSVQLDEPVYEPVDGL